MLSPLALLVTRQGPPSTPRQLGDANIGIAGSRAISSLPFHGSLAEIDAKRMPRAPPNDALENCHLPQCHRSSLSQSGSWEAAKVVKQEGRCPLKSWRK